MPISDKVWWHKRDVKFISTLHTEKIVEIEQTKWKYEKWSQIIDNYYKLCDEWIGQSKLCTIIHQNTINP